MIEVARSQLDPHSAERWRKALEQTPVLTAARNGIDPEMRLIAAVLWVVPLLVTFQPIAAESPAVMHGVRALSAAMCALSALGAMRTWRSRAPLWPRGRFLFRWGYAEIDQDILRCVPMRELEHEIRGRLLGIGPIGLTLRSGRWSTAFRVKADDVERLAIALEEARAACTTQGYRGMAPVVVGPRERGFVRRRAPEIGSVCLAVLVGAAALPRNAVGGDAPAVEEMLNVAPESASGPVETAPGARVEIAGCLETPEVISAVETFLRLSLVAPPGRPRPSLFSPVPLHRPRGAVGFWADCTWELDPRNGTLLRAHARWGVDRAGRQVPDPGPPETTLDHEATVEVGDAIAVIGACRLAEHGAPLSHEGLAVASLRLIGFVLRRDLTTPDAVIPARSDAEAAPWEACVAERAATVLVTHLEDLDGEAVAP